MGEAGPIPSQERLLAIIELQNALAAAALTTEEIMRIVADRAALLVSAVAATVELVEGDDMVYRASSGAPAAAENCSIWSSPLSERRPAGPRRSRAALGSVPCHTIRPSIDAVSWSPAISARSV